MKSFNGEQAVMGLLETVSSQRQDTEIAVRRRSNRRKQKTGITARQRSPGFLRINGDSMSNKHAIYQVPTPARTGGGGRDGTGLQA